MKKHLLTLALLLTAAGASAQELYFGQPAPRTPGSHLGASLNAGLTGVGATFSTPLGKYFTARVGFGTLPYTYQYTEDALTLDISAQLAQHGLSDLNINTEFRHEVDLKAKLNVPAAHVLVDYTPFREGLGAFHVTAGLYIGGGNLIHVTGNSNLPALQQKLDAVRDQINALRPGAGDLLDIDVRDVALDLGDAGVHLNADGTADAYARVNSVRPYLGIGWGNAIPTRRVGFRFDIGAMYQGRPEITSPNADRDLHDDLNSNATLNKVLDHAAFYPQLSFQITFRIL